MRSLLVNTLLFLVCVAIFAGLYIAFPQMSGFAAGLLKASMGIFFLWIVDKTLLYNLKTVEELQRGNIAAAIFLLGLAMIVAATVATAQPVPSQDVCLTSTWQSDTERTPPALLRDFNGREFEPTGIAHLDSALTYVGVKETRPNRGPEVDRFTRIGARLDPPIYWCAAFVSYNLRVTGGDVLDERGVSRLGGVATRMITHRSVSARDVLRGVVRPEPGWIVIWRRGRGWTGHDGFFVVDENWQDRGRPWFGRCGNTVEGNTSSGRGNQRNGDGVYRRTRCIEPGAYFRIVAFTPVDYPSLGLS